MLSTHRPAVPALFVVGAFLCAACSSSDTTVAGYGGSGGAGGAGSPDAAAGAFPGSGGSSTAGSGGATPDAASAGDSTAPRSYCGCSTDAAQDETGKSAVTVTFTNFTYSPQCIKVKVGTTVTFSGDFSVHPLAPDTTVSDPGNPVKSVSTGTSADVAYSTPGFYGYFCTHHVSLDMCGAVYVVP